MGTHMKQLYTIIAFDLLLNTAHDLRNAHGGKSNQLLVTFNNHIIFSSPEQSLG